MRLLITLMLISCGHMHDNGTMVHNIKGEPCYWVEAGITADISEINDACYSTVTSNQIADELEQLQFLREREIERPTDYE